MRARGPILVLVLALLLAVLLVHVAENGFDAAATFGMLCVAVEARASSFRPGFFSSIQTVDPAPARDMHLLAFSLSS